MRRAIGVCQYARPCVYWRVPIRRMKRHAAAYGASIAAAGAPYRVAEGARPGHMRRPEAAHRPGQKSKKHRDLHFNFLYHTASLWT